MAKEDLFSFFLLAILMANSCSERLAEGCELGDKECTSLDLSGRQLIIMRSGMFDGMTKLAILNLCKNKLAEIESNSFQDLNSLTDLYLSENKLVNIKSGTFKGLIKLEVLSLTKNEIIEIEPNSFQDLNALSDLRFEFNRLELITNESFLGLNSLLNLDFSFQNFKNFSLNTLSGFPSVKEIKLNNNLINAFPVSSIHHLSWNYLKNVIFIDLSFNQLSFLDSHSFDYLVSVNFLNLSNNFLNCISSSLFSFNRNLKYLDFSYNLIFKIDHYAFSSLNQSDLVHLDLSYNRLDFIKNYFFVKLSNLEKLNLRSNSISLIEESSFNDLVNLTDLDLSENCLFQIEKKLFQKTFKLISMNLSFNIIKKFEPQTLLYLKRLANLSLSNNLIEHFSNSLIDKLTYLDFSFNILLKEFKFTNGLVFAYLNGNRMMRKLIQPNYELSNLKYLYLRQVRAFLIESVNFNLMPNLLELDLSSNKLMNLTNLGRYNNIHLKSLWLRNIDISFESSLFVRFPKLEVLDIGGCKQMNWSQNDISNLISLTKLSLNNLKMKLDLRFIANLTSLEYLDVSNNQIETIYIPNLFEKLKTKKIKYLNLNYNKLREFDSFYLFFYKQEFLEVLDLSFNSIITLDLKKLSMKNIKVLKANNNNLTHIDIQSLVMGSEIYDLSFNGLSSFQKTFASPVLTKSLKLNDNIFEYLTDEMFRSSLGLYASKLVSLDLSRNRIKHLSETSLLDFFNLEYLKLRQNQLIRIENETFKNLIKLIELDLSKNHLRKLDKTLLKSSRFLLKLNLSSNKLEFLDRELFMNLKQLVDLDMSFNSIKSFSFLDDGLSKLTDLNIQSNSIARFEQLHGLDSMKNFYISPYLLNKAEYVKNLINSFFKMKPIKSRLISVKNNESIQYFKSVSVIYPNNQMDYFSFYKTDRDCFNVLYLMKFRIILNLKDKEQLELFMSICESYIHKLFFN